MSAFVMSPDEIGKVAAFAAHLQQSGHLVDETPNRSPVRVSVEGFAAGLAMANLESVGYRYRMDVNAVAADAGAPGAEPYVNACAQAAKVQLQVFRQHGPDLEKVESVVDSYDYQACEVPNWPEERPAKWVAQMHRYLKTALGRSR